MPATITLSTVPGSIERHDGYTSKLMKICGTSLARETVAITTVTDIRAAVQAFGQRVRAAHPDASFQVYISMRKGERKPKGYDATYLRNGFGQEDFMRVVDKRTTPATEPSETGADAAVSPAA